MHQLWTIPELFQSILRCGCLTEGDLYRVALVSLWFWKATVPVLWEYPSFPDRRVGLGLLLPESQILALKEWISKKDYDSDLPLPDYMTWDLDRFHLHASYIKRLEVDIDDSFLTLMAVRNAPSRFSQLRCLCLSVFNLPKHISVPRVLETEAISARTTVALISVLDMVQGASLPLTQFTLRSGNNGVSFVSELEVCSRLQAFIEAHTQIRFLELSGLLHRLQHPFIAASKLPNLTEFSGVCSQYITASQLQTLAPTPCNGFPSLTKFRGDVPLHDIHIVLSSIASDVLETLSITSWEAPTSPLAGGLEGIRRFGGLRSFCLSWNGDGAVNWESLQPVLYCSRLQDVELVGPSLSVFVDDERLEKMFKAWPILAT